MSQTREINLSDVANNYEVKDAQVSRLRLLVHNAVELIETRAAELRNSVEPHITTVKKVVEPRLLPVWKAITRQDVRELEEALQHVLGGKQDVTPAVRERITAAKEAIAAETVTVKVTHGGDGISAHASA